MKCRYINHIKLFFSLKLMEYLKILTCLQQMFDITPIRFTKSLDSIVYFNGKKEVERTMQSFSELFVCIYTDWAITTSKFNTSVHYWEAQH